MQSGLVILSILLVVSLSHAAIQNVFNFEIPQGSKNQDQKTRFSDIIDNLLTGYHFPQKQQQNIVDILTNGGKQMLNGFKFKDCGGYAGKIKNLKLVPDPLLFPGQLTVLASVELNETLNTPLQMKVTMEKDRINIPCLGGGIGSCSYDDVCSLLANVTCPDPLVQYGIPCQCPFDKNTYNLPGASFDIQVPFLPSGNYHINAKINSQGKQAVCLDVYATVE